MCVLANTEDVRCSLSLLLVSVKRLLDCIFDLMCVIANTEDFVTLVESSADFCQINPR